MPERVAAFATITASCQWIQEVQEETRVKAAGDDFARSIASLQARQDLPAIVRGMAAHADHAGVQEQGCAALKKLAFNNADNKSTDN